MIIVCQKCTTRLQIDDEKTPQRPFNVRCPKCNNTISSGQANPATEHSALAVGGSPATEHPRFEQTTAPVYQPATVAASNGAGTNDDALRAIRLFASRIADAIVSGRTIRESAQADEGGDGEGDERARRGRANRQARPEQATSPASV